MFEDQGINFLPVTTVDFGAVALGSQATINLSPFNQGSAPAILQQASLTGDFSATPVITTPLLLQPGGPPSAPVFIPHFSFAVTFKPTAAGARSGQFVLTEAALNGSHIVQLTGTGVTDFSLSADPDSNQVSVLQGGSAIATMHLSAAPGFTGSVSFSCSGLPAGASCSASPASFSFSGAGGTQKYFRHAQHHRLVRSLARRAFPSQTLESECRLVVVGSRACFWSVAGCRTAKQRARATSARYARFACIGLAGDWNFTGFLRWRQRDIAWPIRPYASRHILNHRDGSIRQHRP
jgi:hypothetical protein